LRLTGYFCSLISVDQLPFLPVEFFKKHRISCYPEKYELEFTSSSTSGIIPGKHFIHKSEIYNQSILNGFTHFFGNPEKFNILALLPSYLDRKDASLVYMVSQLINKSSGSKNRFYLHDYKKLIDNIHSLRNSGREILLLGVTFALLDLAEQFPEDLSDIIIMETGGMKGKRKEMVREEVHSILCKAFGVSKIHSEYGMTELLSQAYSKGNGLFKSPPWMKVLIRDMNDPLSFVSIQETGGINIIDLANLYSCAFIATQDLGKLHTDGSFEVLGRFDHSDIRGCNLMVD